MNKVAVVIASTDSFQDCFPATLECLRRFWPNPPWPIYTTSNSIPWGERPILTGGIDAGWVANLSNALDHLNTEFILLFLEDQLLFRAVDTAELLKVREVMLAFPEIGAFHVGQGDDTLADPEIEKQIGHGVGHKVALESNTRITTAPCLWRTAYLRKILANCGTTAWDFEGKGSEFSKTQPEEIWTHKGTDEVNRAFRCFYSAITRGKWDRNAVEWLKKDFGLEVNTDRGFMECQR